MLKYIYSESLFNFLHSEMIYKCHKHFVESINVRKHSYFFCELQFITFFLIHDSHMSWTTRFMFLKVCAGFSVFDFVSFSELTFLFNKKHELFKMSQLLSTLKQMKSHTNSYSQTTDLEIAIKSFKIQSPSAWVGALQKMTRRKTF